MTCIQVIILSYIMLRKTVRIILENFFDENKVFSGAYVNKYIKDITPNQEDLPTWFMNTLIAPRKFKMKEVNIEDLLKTDIDFKDYYNNGEVEDRYEFDDINPNDINQELVIVDGILVDGYNRASMLLRQGESKTTAFVAI